MKSIVILISAGQQHGVAVRPSWPIGSLPVLVAVISNRPDAKGLEIAAAQGWKPVVDHTL